MRKTRTNAFIIGALMFSILLGLYYIYLDNELAQDTLIAARLNSQIEQISFKNVVLRGEIAKYESFTVIASRAAEFGFKRPLEYIDIK